MLPKMRYRLGLDLGTTSIGWCMIRLDNNRQPVAIIKMGVRIFSDGRNPKDGTSLAVTRRQARQARRRRDRLLKRKALMMDALIRLGFFPQDEEKRKALAQLDPYALRKKGLYEQLTGAEFARALFHINQRRGFLSNRKTDSKDNESGALKTAIKKLHERLEQEDCQTLGEWLANRHERGESVRARLRGKTRKERAYDFYADRAMVEHEFDTLWKKQAEFNPALFSNEAHDELKDILLFQRPLKPVTPGRCTLLPTEERAPLALPSSQRFRIYQESNNLRYITDGLKQEPLSLEQRDQVVKLLEHGDATFTKIRKALNFPGTTQFNLEDIKRDRLKGNKTSAVLAKKQHFGKAWHDFSHELQDQIVTRLLNEENLTTLIDWLMENTGIDESRAEAIADASLPQGYGNLGRKALSRILPELEKEVITYAKAVTRAGFDSHSALSASQQTGEIHEQLPYYGIPLERHVGFGTGRPDDPTEKRYGKIANPTVHIGLNELRKVINKLIKRYGHPQEIVVEVARELKLSRERKLQIQKEQKSRQDLNQRHVEEACKVLNLTPDNLDKGKRRELSQKMQLWVELNERDITNRRCPYTGEAIDIDRLLSSDVEIEHILPYSKTLDDSMNNKTVSMSRANRYKGNRTPYEAFGDNKDGYDYNSILQRAALMPKAKQKRFAEDGYQQWLRDDKDFLARALNDTAYLSRIAREYLSLVCPDGVRSIPGRMTALLRGKYGLDRLLSGTANKNRNDHRHHALDAAVIAITDQGLLKRFADASASARRNHLDRLVDEMPLPWHSYREHVERALNNIIVSHRPDHGYQGAMHEATAWRPLENGKATMRERPEGGGPATRVTKKKKLVLINSTRDKQRHGLDENGKPKPYKGYVGGSNYCIEIWREETGKWRGDVITTYQAYQIIRKYGEKEGWKKLRNPRQSQSGKPLVMRLMINDMVKMRIDGDYRIMRLVKINNSNGNMTFAMHNESNLDERSRNKNDPFSYTNKLAGSLQKTEAKLAKVSETGEVNIVNHP